MCRYINTMVFKDPDHLAGLIFRMKELVSYNTPWHRRSWRTGTVALGRELLDECLNPELPSSALSDLTGYFRFALNSDAGVNDRGKAIEKPLKELKSGSARSHHWYSIRSYLDALEQSYLHEWRRTLASPPSTIEMEQVADALIAHFVDTGYHQESLFSWIKAWESDSEDHTVVDFISEFIERTKEGPREYEICAPTLVMKPLPVGMEGRVRWIDKSAYRFWVDDYVGLEYEQEANGALIFTVAAFEKNSALAIARNSLRTLEAHYSLTPNSALHFAPHLHIKGHRKAFPRKVPARTIALDLNLQSARFLTLGKWDQGAALYSLLYPVLNGPAHIAVSSAWSAIESVFVGPGDDSDVIAARRFAEVVIASRVRSEFAQLLKEIKNSERPTDSDLKILEGQSNSEQIRILISQLTTADTPEERFSGMGEKLAVKRSRMLFQSPSKFLEDEIRSFERELIRLYRKRNLVAHLGRAEPTEFRTTIDRLAPFIGAGFESVQYVTDRSSTEHLEISAVLSFRLTRVSHVPQRESVLFTDLLSFPQVEMRSPDYRDI